jgi:hypothetical protein
MIGLSAASSSISVARIKILAWRRLAGSIRWRAGPPPGRAWRAGPPPGPAGPSGDQTALLAQHLPEPRLETVKQLPEPDGQA